MSIQDIGELVGYAETRVFTRAFKQWTGMSPAHYRTDLARRFRAQNAITE